MPIPSLTFLDYFNPGGQYQWLQFLSILCQIPVNAPENQGNFRMEDYDDPGHFIKLPLEFGVKEAIKSSKHYFALRRINSCELDYFHQSGWNR
jgi:hypothetical protein